MKRSATKIAWNVGVFYLLLRNEYLAAENQDSPGQTAAAVTAIEPRASHVSRNWKTQSASRSGKCVARPDTIL